MPESQLGFDVPSTKSPYSQWNEGSIDVSAPSTHQIWALRKQQLRAIFGLCSARRAGKWGCIHELSHMCTCMLQRDAYGREREGRQAHSASAWKAPDGQAKEAARAGWEPLQPAAQVMLSRPRGGECARECLCGHPGCGAVGVMKLKCELRLRAELVQGAQKQEMWELPHLLVRRSYVAAVLVHWLAATFPSVVLLHSVKSVEEPFVPLCGEFMEGFY